MQTFVPCSTFKRCAEVLDYLRLGKQRIEALQIENALIHGGGWASHPAVLMWDGFIPALRQYRRAIILEWIARGYRNTMDIPRATRCTMPNWWNGSIHRSHRAALLYKDFHHYSRYWVIQPELDYYWPISSRTRRK